MAIRVLLSPPVLLRLLFCKCSKYIFPLPLICSVSLRQQASNNEGAFGL